MNLLQGNIKNMYFKYLTAAFGSALISSIYNIVDMAMVGQYQGPEGTAALAVVAPVWNIIYSLGLLTGIGGAIQYSAAKGYGKDQIGNEYFSTSLITTIVLSLISWVCVCFFDKQMLTLFGAEETLLPLAQKYLVPIKFVVPLFLFNQTLAAFLRNDYAPGLATKAVLAGGIFNVFGDYFFVFTLKMGIMGAGLATAMGAIITFVIMLTHFISKENSLRIVQINHYFSKCKQIVITGFSTFFIDVAMGILTVLFNRQIVKYLGTDALSIYGVIVNISTVVQCCAYSVGQASQPIISLNFGARKWGRIKGTLKYALYTTAFFSVLWTGLMLVFPNGFIRIFMAATDEIYQIAPFIMRSYGLSFILLPLNIFSTYYFQSIMKPGSSFIISVARGLVVSGGLIYLLPVMFGADSIWMAMPVTELVIAVIVVIMIYGYTKNLSKEAYD